MMPELSAAHLRRAWRWYRARLWLFAVALPLWAGANLLLDHAGSARFATWVYPLLFAAMVFPTFFFAMHFRCPRCSRHLYIRGRGEFVFENRCQSCGLRVGDRLDSP